MDQEPLTSVQPEVVTTEPIRKDPKGVALASFIIGIVDLFAWCFPVCGFIFCIAGVVTGILGIKSTRRWMAITGIALSAVGFILSIVWLILRNHLVQSGIFNNLPYYRQFLQ